MNQHSNEEEDSFSLLNTSHTVAADIDDEEEEFNHSDDERNDWIKTNRKYTEKEIMMNNGESAIVYLSGLDSSLDKSLLETLCVHIEGLIGPVVGKSKMVQHPNFPNQFHISKSAHFMVGVFKERIDQKKSEIREKKKVISQSNGQLSEEYSFLLIQELISKHVSAVEDQSGVFIYCLNRMYSIMRKEFENISTSRNRMKMQKELSMAINYFVQILLPNVILNELIDDCFDPFEEVQKTYNLCFSFLVPHVNNQIAHTLSKTMMDWLLSLETETIYKLSKDRKLFDFFVNAIPLAPTENNTKVLPGILVGECSYIYPKSYNLSNKLKDPIRIFK
ncbi:predicted protein [Naegleria gruberi]|uniref:Predicted protein n=1 Tax=Naegleria gruberi TaxID=5762 RepID=D2V0V5_NAEGR|nr:uncharacterized protein NAEGRDRAFT_62429 [Naegleria gruberi]EFC49795.1 predicted protein [Naegleria gruberi]|eukprot:XP_002682539.1 predicted protein [Naegleria gruberi strain NEG-M]